MALDRGKFEVTVFKDNNATDTRQVPAGGASVAIFQEGATVKTEANILSGVVILENRNFELPSI